ncbi:mechanosensitive ion channel family protein [Rhodohalobacter sp. 8-1]|uniref:mechanosensitive ion channel family protein n=1 Tax=Rhodohalobacter sp. 8-1 TaxID=3131972 RepID=UPI0030ECD887
MDFLNDLTGNSDALTAFFITRGMSLIGAVIILIIGFTIAGWAAKRVRNSVFKSENFDDTLAPVFGQTVKAVILIVTLLAVLGQFGVETASIIAILGAAGLAVGLALQGTLSNVASGMMLLILRPFKVGDVIEVAGTFGVVDEVGLFTTEMHSFDNIGIVVPNSRVWGSEIQNLTQFDTRRCDLEFDISYTVDMDKAIGLIKDILDADDRILDEPEPLIAISALDDSSVVIRVRPWTATSDLWPLRYDLIKRVKEVFDENDISIPFPQRDVHLFQNN